MKTVFDSKVSRGALAALLTLSFGAACDEVDDDPPFVDGISYECADDEDCVGGACVEGACVPYACTADEECEIGACVDHACVPNECTEDEDCEVGACVDHTCVPHECTEDEDCEGGACMDHACVPHECTADEDCERGACMDHACVPHECTADEDCESGLCEDHACLPTSTCIMARNVDSIEEALARLDCEELRIPAGEFAVSGLSVERPFTIRGAGPEKTTLDAKGEGRHFLLLEQVSLRLEGLTLRGGVEAKGGSVRAEKGSELVLKDVSFTQNQATDSGGAVSLQQASLIAEDCRFSDNHVDSDRQARGGAVAVERGESVLLRCSFEGNHAMLRGGNSSAMPLGGALYLNSPTTAGSPAHLEDCSFVGNWVAGVGKYITQRGGAVSFTGARATMVNVEFLENRAVPPEECEKCDAGGGAFFQSRGSLEMKGFRFAGNSNVAEHGLGSRRGGAMFLFNVPSVDLQDGSFEENIVLDGGRLEGGAIKAHFTNVTADEVVHRYDGVQFVENVAVCAAEECGPNAWAHGGALDYEVESGTVRLYMDRVVGVDNGIDAPSTSAAGGFARLSVKKGAALSTRIQNSTLSGNFSPAHGSALAYKGNTATSGAHFLLELFNTTVSSGETAKPFHLYGKSSIPKENQSFRFRNTIIDSLNGVCDLVSNGQLVSSGWLVAPSDSECPLEAAPTDIITDAPGLLPLADNGGDTLTHALTESSPAKNAGEAGGCTDGSDSITVDQRGIPRTTPNCTPGAYSE